MNTQDNRGASLEAISTDDALGLLMDEPRCHTFVPMGGLLGCDMDRADVMAAVRASPRCWLSSEIGMGHDLRITRGGRVLFVEVDGQKVRALRARLGLAAATGVDRAGGSAILDASQHQEAASNP
jgi:hypothetical protein